MPSSLGYGFRRLAVLVALAAGARAASAQEHGLEVGHPAPEIRLGLLDAGRFDLATLRGRPVEGLEPRASREGPEVAHWMAPPRLIIGFA